jgi:hypothetical protein
VKQYLIGDLLIRMDYGGMPVQTGENLRLFRHDTPWEGEEISFTAGFEPFSCDPVERMGGDNGVYEIYARDKEMRLVYHWGNLHHGFAVWPDRFHVSYNPNMHGQPALREDWFFSIIAFHRQLLQREACIIHASYVDVGGQAVLFTGPSNIGKSTQAELWKGFAGAQIINGDRALLRCRNGKWHSFAYPCCGTSGICVNRTLPLRAVVVLQQDHENRVEQLSMSGKIRSLAAAMELYPWSSKELDMAFALAEKIAAQIPVIKLCCRPDAKAVEVLKDYLEENSYA